MAPAKALTARRIEQITSKSKGQVGWYRDAGSEAKGLHLQVTRLSELNKPAAACWVLRYTMNGKQRYAGLGSLSEFNLAEARDRARKVRQQIRDGVDPVAQREAEKAARQVAAARKMTFKECADRYFEEHQGKWRSAVHRQQFQSTMATYVLPTLGALPVADIDTPLVLQVLEPIWRTKTETASRTRQRIEATLAWAAVRGYRSETNPARWKNHLDKVLPAPGEISKTEHHASMPYAEVPGFMRALPKRPGFAARALELTILCATRTGETIGAQWSEFDLKAGTWTIPAGRMKALKEHRIPLSDQAVAMLKALPREGEVVFPGLRAGIPVSNMAMSAVLKRMDRAVTTHGFRASFRTWAAERTNYPEPVIEAALAHIVSDPVIKAYRRTSFYERRAKLMQAWADYLD